MKVKAYETLLNESNLPYMNPVKEFKVDGRKVYSDPYEIYTFLKKEMNLDRYAEEHVWGIALDSKLHITGCFEVSHGTVNVSYCSPREFFMKALLLGAVHIVLTHNHPGGDPAPSKQDMELTEKIKEAGKIMGVYLVDHIIVTKDNYYSFSENMLLNA